jgi:hypothetical protein
MFVQVLVSLTTIHVSKIRATRTANTHNTKLRPDSKHPILSTTDNTLSLYILVQRTTTTSITTYKLLVSFATLDLVTQAISNIKTSRITGL